MSALFSSKKRTSPRRLLQNRPPQGLKTKRTRTELYPSSFWIKEPGYMLGKRLGGYTQWVHFFFKKAHITQKTSSKQEFSNNIRFKTLQLFVPNSKRLRSYTQMGILFSSKRNTPREDLMKRYTVLLKKALGRCLFLLGKAWRNKMRLPELNHEVLGGLSVRDPWDTPHRREN